ncbi:MAG: UbiA family prenyltransferase [Candidatus Helarchaeota archaeon]|nr:UbiA family prenyltransferase [Candidatus Helarchaeota archaeon]
MSRIIEWLKTYREFIRVGPFFVLNLMLVLSALLGGLNLSISLMPLILSMISLSLAWNFGVIVNDYYDMEIDRINYPNRPVVRGALTSTQLKLLAISHIIISLIIAILVDIFTLIYISSIIVILFLYSVPLVRIKKTIFATGVIGFICGMAILIGGSVSSYSAENLYMALWVTIGISLLGPIKDFKDIEGDKAEGMKTLPILFGIKKATYILMGFATFSVILGITILEFLLQKPILASILVIILGIATIILLELNLKEKIDPRRAHNITFILLSFCLLSFFL